LNCASAEVDDNAHRNGLGLSSGILGALVVPLHASVSVAGCACATATKLHASTKSATSPYIPRSSPRYFSSAVQLPAQCLLIDAKLRKFFIFRRSYELPTMGHPPGIGA
jgi:hypothetical protein